MVIDQDIQPVAQQQRKIPFHLREKGDKQLEHLQRGDISEHVPEDEKTDWVSPIVCSPKKNSEICICVDTGAANRAIKHVRHPIPTINDIALDLNEANVFSKLDVTQAFHQVELSPQSQGITTFTTHIGLFQYKRLNYGTTPLWPQGNAHVKAFNKPLGKAFQTAHVEHRKWKQELQRFLLNYRTTPHMTTKVPPAQLSFTKVVKGTLPVLERKSKVVDRHLEAGLHNEATKESAKTYTDFKRRVKQSEIKSGDTVLCQQQQKNKLTTRFNPVPFTVITIKGTRVTTRSGNKVVTRNVSYFKRIW